MDDLNNSLHDLDRWANEVPQDDGELLEEDE